MVPTGSKRAVLGTLKPMHFSFVTKLMIFGKFDHLHLPQPQGRHGKVHQFCQKYGFCIKNLCLSPKSLVKIYDTVLTLRE